MSVINTLKETLKSLGSEFDWKKNNQDDEKIKNKNNQFHIWYKMIKGVANKNEFPSLKCKPKSGSAKVWIESFGMLFELVILNFGQKMELIFLPTNGELVRVASFDQENEQIIYHTDIREILSPAKYILNDEGLKFNDMLNEHSNYFCKKII